MDCAKTWQTKEATVEKIHMGICPISHEILVEETTELEIADCQNNSYDAEKTSQVDQEGHWGWGL